MGGISIFRVSFNRFYACSMRFRYWKLIFYSSRNPNVRDPLKKSTSEKRNTEYRAIRNIEWYSICVSVNIRCHSIFVWAFYNTLLSFTVSYYAQLIHNLLGRSRSDYGSTTELSHPVVDSVARQRSKISIGYLHILVAIEMRIWCI